MRYNYKLEWTDTNLEKLSTEYNVFKNWVVAVIPLDEQSDKALHQTIKKLSTLDDLELSPEFDSTVITLNYNRFFDANTCHEFYDFKFWHETIISDELYMFTIENNFHKSLDEMVKIL